MNPHALSICIAKIILYHICRCQSLECMMFLLNIILLGAEALMILNLILTTSKEERARLPENNLLKIFAADKEKASLWCARDHLTKRNWQWPMNEEDIIDTLSNSVTVHETKLKVDNICGET
ncbi:uncharacterized protein LOC133740493 [Rosa rugosa]|uniref:uncharacterized protein LOC133740493 n=1 Tax=Rosa rugosa TaxID=74645 RepID=UPI002B416B81|nr:uncharacterized protein LOC133740493 [Rosa rugosa]